MYHLLKDLNSCRKRYDDIFQALLNNDATDLIRDILKTRYLGTSYTQKTYSSKTTIALINGSYDIRLSRNVVLEDYFSGIEAESLCLIDMIRYHNFTEESEVRAKKMLRDLKQEDLVYLAPDNSCYAEPFLIVNCVEGIGDAKERYIPLINTRSIKETTEITMQHYEDLECNKFAEDIELDGRYFYYVSKGYKINTNVIDGVYVLVIGNSYEDYKFLNNMAKITACAIFAMTLKNDMPRFKQLFPKMRCSPIDSPMTNIELQIYTRNCYSCTSSPNFVSKHIYRTVSYDELSRPFLVGNHNSVQGPIDYRDKYACSFEKKICLLSIIYSGKTIWIENMTEEDIMILQPFVEIYNMINRVKFGSFKMAAYRDITIVC